MQQRPTPPSGLAPVSAPPSAASQQAIDMAACFVDRSGLLVALVALETLALPLALRPRELRSDVW
jgi:hypothetical protein